MRGALLLGLRVAVSASILAVILSRVSVHEVLSRATGGAPHYLAAGLALALAAVVLVALRWRLLAHPLGLAMSAGLAVRALFVAVFGGQVLPSGLGADLLRGWLVAQHAPGVSRIVASLMADRLVALFAACLLLLPSYGRLGAAAVLASGGALLGFLLVMRRMGVLAKGRLPGGRVLLAIAIAVAVHAATVVMAILAASAYRIEASPALWLAVIPLSVIASAIPVSLNGWGVREAAIVVLAAPLGVAPAEALLVSVTLGLLNMLGSLPGALVLLRARGRALV